MILRQQILVLLADGNPHEVRDLYSRLGREIRPEEAAHLYGERSKLALQDRVQRGRMRILIHNLASLAKDQYVTTVAGSGLYRTYLITELGKERAKKWLAQAGLGEPDPNQKIPRPRDLELSLQRAQIRAELLPLLKDKWEEYHLVFEILSPMISEELALRSYNLTKKQKREQNRTYMVELGRRKLYQEVVSELKRTRLVETKIDEEARKWIRAFQGVLGHNENILPFNHKCG